MSIWHYLLGSHYKNETYYIQPSQDLENTLKDMAFGHLQENVVIPMVKN